MMRVFLRWVCILQFTPNSRPEMKPFSGYNVNYEYHRCWLLPYMRTDPFPRRGNEERRRVPKVSHAYARTSDPVREVYTRVCRCHNYTLSSSRRSRTAQPLLACIQFRRPPKPATWTWPPPPVRPPTSRPEFLSHLVISRPIHLSWASDDDDSHCLPKDFCCHSSDLVDVDGVGAITEDRQRKAKGLFASETSST